MNRLSLCVFSVLLQIFGSLATPAQNFTFTRANGPFAGEITSLVVHQNRVFALVSNADPANVLPRNVQNGVYTSTDNASTWTRLTQVPEASNIQTLISINRTLIALTSPNAGGRLYRSRDAGLTWQQISGGISGFTHIVVAGDSLIARTGIGTASTSALLASTDDGETWQNVQQAGRSPISSMVSFRSQKNQNQPALFGGSSGLGLFKSIDRGRTWQPVTISTPNLNVTVFALVATPDDSLLLATNHGVYASNDAGLTWTLRNNGLGENIVQTLIMSGRSVFAGTSAGLFRSDVVNGTWEKLTITGLGANESATSVIMTDTEKMIVLGTQRGIFRLKTETENAAWGQANAGLPSHSIIAQALVSQSDLQENPLFVSTQTGGVFRAIDGRLWMPSRAGLENAQLGGSPARIIATPSALFLVNKTNTFTSLDVGATWNVSAQGIVNEDVSAVAKTNQGLFIGTKNGVIFRSTSNGAAWTRVQTDFAAQINALIAGESKFFAATNNGLAESSNAGGLWSLLPNNRFSISQSVSALAAENGTLLAGTNLGVMRSLDDGATWRAAPVSMGAVTAFAFRAGEWYAGTASQGVFRSTDNGISWFRISGERVENVTALLITERKLLVGTETGIWEANLQPASFLVPLIVSLSQDTVIATSPDFTLIIRGRNFLPTTRVEFGGQVVPSRTVSSSQVVATIPSRLVQSVGDVVIECSNPSSDTAAVPRSSTLFRIIEGSMTAPIVFTVSPDSVFIGENATLAIIGRNLAGATVFLGSDALAVPSASNLRLEVSVPARLLQTPGNRTMSVISSRTNDRTSFTLRVVLRPEPTVQISSPRPVLTTFSTFLTIPSALQTFTLSATRVVNVLNIAAPQGFQVSSNGALWSDTLAVNARTDSTITDAPVLVRFLPRESRVYADSLVFVSGRGVVWQKVPVSGVITSLFLQTSPSTALNLGVVRIGSTTQAIVRVTNPTPITVTLAVVVIATNPSTSVSNASIRTASGQLNLAPNESQNVIIVFTPKEQTPYKAQLRLLGAASATLDISGEGGQAVVTFSSANIQFSTSAYIRQRIQLPTEQVTVRNSGNMDETVTSVRFEPEGVASVVNTAPFQLLPNASRMLTVQFQPRNLDETLQNSSTGTRVESRLSLILQNTSQAATIDVSGFAKVLQAPQLLAPSDLVRTNQAPLQWTQIPDATSYDAVLTENIANLTSNASRVATVRGATSATVSVARDKAYHWSVRSVRFDAASGDTLVTSLWQTPQFFYTFVDAPPAITRSRTLDFGTVPLERLQNRVPQRTRSYMIPVPSDSMRIRSIVFLANQAVFSMGKRDQETLTFAPLRAATEYAVPVTFAPQEAREYKGLMVLGIQEKGREFEWAVDMKGAGVVCRDVARNTVCPTTRIELRLLPEKPNIDSSKIFQIGAAVKLQVRLVSLENISAQEERFFRTIKMKIAVQNSSILVFRPELRTGNPPKGREKEAVVIRSQPRRSDGKTALQQSLIELEVERPLGMTRDVVLAEIPATATVGINGIGTSRIDAVDSANIVIADEARWLNDSGVEIPNVDVLGARDTLTARVSTCLDGFSSTGSILSQSSDIRAISPNPAEHTTSITFAVQKAGSVQLDVLNTLGTRMKSLIQGEYSPGIYTVDCAIDTLPTGAYLLVLRTPFATHQGRMEVVK
jgi:hypothetical protein